ALPFRDVLETLVLQPLDRTVVFIQTPLSLVELARLQYLVIFTVNSNNSRRDLIAKIRIFLPLNRSFCNTLHDCRRMFYTNFTGSFVFVPSAHATGVHQIDFHRRRFEQLPKTIALLCVLEWEKRISSWNSEEFACLCGASGRRASRLTQHEVGSCLVSIQLCDSGNNVVVAVKDEKEVGRFDLTSIQRAGDILHPHNRPAILCVAGVV